MKSSKGGVGVKTHSISIPADVMREIEKELPKSTVHKIWEAWEEEVIRRYFGKMTMRQIAKILIRSYASVKSKKNELIK